MDILNFVHKYPFSKPVHRLIMLRIVAAGEANGNGERIIDNEILSDFCCCSKNMMFRETKELENSSFLTIQKVALVTYVDAGGQPLSAWQCLC